MQSRPMIQSGGNLALKEYTDGILVDVFPHPLSERDSFQFRVFGGSLLDIVERSNLPREYYPFLAVIHEGSRIYRKDWKFYTPKKGQVRIYVTPGGSGGFLRTVAQIAVIAGTLVASAYLGPFAAIGVSLIGNLLVNSIFPPPQPGLLGQGVSSGPLESPTYAISGQSNQKRPYEVVPRVYGKHKIFPNVVANPYTQLLGNKQYLYAVYDLGYGPLEINDIRIGETSLTYFEGVDYRIVEDGDFRVYTRDVDNQSFSVALENVGDEAIRTTRDGTQEFTIDLVFPQGLQGLNNDGSTVTDEVGFDLDYRVEGESTWNRISINSQNVKLNNASLPTGWTRSSRLFVEPLDYYNIRERTQNYYVYTLGLKKGTTQLAFFQQYPSVNWTLNIGPDKYKVKSVATSLPNGDYGTGDYFFITLDRPLDRDYVFNSYYKTVNFIGAGLNFSLIRDVTAFQPNDRIIISKNTSNPLYTSITVNNLASARYEVRVRRAVNFHYGNYQNRSSVVWQILKSVTYQRPVQAKEKHTYLEIKIKASDQLNGTLSNLSVVATSILDVYDGYNWTKKATRNPAWILVDILTGTLNQRRVPKSRLHLESLIKWANYCDEVMDDGYPRATCDFVLDYETTVIQIIQKICSNARATFNLFDGKYGVIIDALKQYPVQIFTPLNSSDFTSTRNYGKVPDAVKVKWVDPISDYNINEVIAYNDGFDENNAKIFEEIETFGVTNGKQAWRDGRYWLAQFTHRKETIQIRVDYENLVCSRGSLIRLSHDVMMVGGDSARVKSVTGDVVTLSNPVEVPQSTSLGYQLRRGNGEISSGSITSMLTTESFRVGDSSLFQVGALVVVGETEKVTIDCLVKAINPGDDFSAVLTLVEYAPQIFTADIGEIGSYSPALNTGTDSANTTPLAIVNLASDYEVLFQNQSYRHLVTLSWELPDNTVVDNYEIYVSTGEGYSLVGYATSEVFEYDVNTIYINVPHEFRVIGVSASGKKISLGEAPSITVIPYPDKGIPSDVESVHLNILTETLQIEWSPVEDQDLSHYEVRYTPETVNPKWFRSSILIKEVSRGTNMCEVQARVGTYLVKAVDLAGNRSVNAALAITKIPALVNLNVVEEIIEEKNFVGVKENVEIHGSTLLLRSVSNEYVSEGWYYSKRLIDLGDVYTARCTQEIIANGFSPNDLMVNWTTLADVKTLSSAQDDDWDVEAYVRVATYVDVMANWPTLASVNTLAKGVGSDWSEWGKFTSGDFTGRYFHFAVRLVSKKNSVTPQLIKAKFNIDMPDRVSSGSDILCPQEGMRVLFNPAFKAKPVVKVSLDDAEFGDQWVISNRTESGFDIQFKNANGESVSRQFDWLAKGYGRRA